MTHITCNYPSFELGYDATFHVILPHIRSTMYRDTLNKIPEGGYKTLYLLHGFCDNAETWITHCGISALCDECNIAVVIPSTGNSFYTNCDGCGNVYNYVTEELISYTRSIFPLSDKREDTFVAGYSMGGYGAMRIGLKKPELFSKVVSISGSLDIRFSAHFVKNCGYTMPSVFGDIKSLKNTDMDLFYCLNQQLTQTDVPLEDYPDFYIACGTEDVFVNGCKKFADALTSNHLKCTSVFTPGEHDWKYWYKALWDAMLDFISK